MARVFAAVKEAGFWVRVFALLVNLVILVVWMVYYELPVVSHVQLTIFYFASPGYTVILAGMTLTSFLEPLGELAVRLYSLLGACLFTVIGSVGFLNYMFHSVFHCSALAIAFLCLLVSALLTLDVLILECGRTLERIAPPDVLPDVPPSDPNDVEEVKT